MNKCSHNGFTIVEILIAASLSLLLVVGILRLYLSTARSYNTQDTITDMNQNASYTCRRLSEEIMQAGTYLPDSGYEVIKMKEDKFDSITIYTNPTATFHQFVIDVYTAYEIPVPNALGFRGTTEIIKLTSDNVLSILNIDNTYNASPFTNGVNVDSDPNEIYLESSASFTVGDQLFASKKRIFFKNSTNFCLDTPENVLAENIDSLAIVFYDTTNTVTTSWESMYFAKIYVRSRSAAPDLKYTHPTINDNYRRYVQTMDVLIRVKTSF